MTQTMLITLLILLIAGLATLWYGIRHSVRGYEDEFGFHEGAEPIGIEVLSESPNAQPAGASEMVSNKRQSRQEARNKEFEHATLGLF
jgi:hypothetical protein